jgi:UDP-glucuronate decarboxylase
MREDTGGRKRILVTGGAGFIGSHLCRVLLSQGHEVICVDNLFTGSKKNIEILMSHKNFEFIRHDITDPLRVEVDQIYNLACPAAPVHYQFNPIKTIKCSTIGMINLLGIAKRCRARILQASTSEVYGDPAEHPQAEKYWGNVNPIGVRSCYDEGKRVAECLMMDYHRQNNVDTAIVRIFNTYGPNMALNDGRVIPNFISQAIKGEPITIYGDGSQTRSFCYVSDLVDGLYKTMNADGFTGPVNLGNPVELSMLELAQKIRSIVGSRSEIVFRPLPADDPRQRKPDITLAKEKLGWEPKASFDEGLEKTAEYFRKILSEN